MYTPEEIGSLLLVGFQGKSPVEPSVVRAKEYVDRGLAGGVILFRYNIAGPDELGVLTSYFASSGKRPWIALDQEGGKVQRLSPANGFTDWPSAKSLAQTRSPAEAEEIYFEMAASLARHGFTFNLGPCVDVDFDPPSPAIGKAERSYGTDTAVVAQFAAAFVRGHRRAGVLTCAKHYPGHGSAQGDTHRGLVDVTTTWKESELEPYRALQEHGLLDAVMTAHIVHTGVDGTAPATLSSVWGAKLRNEVGFQGVVVSDDLHMGAIAGTYTFDETVLGAFAGGCDVFCFSNNPLAAQGVAGFQPDPALPERFVATVQTLVQHGKLTRERVGESIRRVHALKSL